MSNDLLNPRYKVIADYPGCPYSMGDIIEPIGGDNWDCYARPTIKGLTEPDKYSANFKKLQWWEERKREEMPEYVKGYDRIYKMVNWTHNTCGEYFDEVEQSPNRVMFEMKNIIPATAADYEAYLQTLTVK